MTVLIYENNDVTVTQFGGGKKGICLEIMKRDNDWSSLTFTETEIFELLLILGYWLKTPKNEMRPFSEKDMGAFYHLLSDADNE